MIQISGLAQDQELEFWRKQTKKLKRSQQDAKQYRLQKKSSE